MKNIDELRYTSNSQVYKRALKHHRENKGEINCAFCRYHKGENGGWGYNAERSWKKHRKTQYKVVDVG